MIGQEWDELQLAKPRSHGDAHPAREPFLPDELTSQERVVMARARERMLSDLRPRRVSAQELRSMRDWDAACFGGAQGCPDGPPDLMALGFALHRKDATFWTRLRRLGVTPEVVKQANEILLPKDVDVEVAPARPTVCPAERRTHARPRGRRSAPARRSTSSGAARGDPDEPEPAERRRSNDDLALASPAVRP